MQSHTDLRKSPFVRAPLLRAVFGKAALATAALSGFVLFAGVPSAKADSCQRRIQHAEHELREAIEDHGYYSRQADRWRNKRHEAYEVCERERGYYRDRDRDYRRDYDRDRPRYRDWDRDRD